MARNNAIASGSAILTTNADGLKSGLARAEQDVKGWSGRVGGLFGKGFKFGLGVVAAQGMVHTLEAIGNKFSEMTEKIDATSKQARAFGTSTEFLTGLQHAADLSGVNVEELSAGLARFRRQVDGPLDDALYALADRLEGVGDAGERARILTENFGKTGVKFAAVFEDGADGIKKLVAENKAMGNSFTEEQGKQVEAANDAITRAKKSFGGLFQQLIIQFAPVIEKLAVFAQKAFTFLRPVFDWIGRWADTMFTLWGAVFDAIGDAVSAVADVVGELFGDLFGFTGEMPTVKEVIVGVWRAVGVAASYVWDTFKVGAGVVSWIAGAIVEAFGEVLIAISEAGEAMEDWVSDIRPEIREQLGQDSGPGGFRKFADRAKATGDRMGRWGKDAMNSWGQSADKFNEWLDKALQPKEAGKEMGKKVAEGIEETMEATEIKLAGAMLRGSKEAYSLTVQNSLRDLKVRDEPVKNLVKEAKKGNDIAKRNEKNTDKMARRLDDLGEI